MHIEERCNRKIEINEEMLIFFLKAISNNETRLIEHDLGHEKSWQDLSQYLELGKKVNFFREN